MKFIDILTIMFCKYVSLFLFISGVYCYLLSDYSISAILITGAIAIDFAGMYFEVKE